MRRIGSGLHRFWRKAYEDNLTGLAAMVAYNLLLSVFPLALIALFVAGRVLSSPELGSSVLADLQQLFPTAAETTLRDALRRAARVLDDGRHRRARRLASGSARSFWGALDTAFCRIYHRPVPHAGCARSSSRLGMLVVVLLFIARDASRCPPLQALLVSGAADLPFGLVRRRGARLRDLARAPAS